MRYIVDLDSIGARIQYARQKKGMTQIELGQALGLSASFSHRVSQWEHSLRVPRREKIIQIAEILDVSPAWLTFGDANN